MNNMKNSIVVVGLGYVGYPLACAFSKNNNVIGYDIDKEKIEKYRKDSIRANKSSENNILFTCNSKEISKGKYIIIAVPTPIDSRNNPNLNPIIEATKIVGQNMKEKAIIIYESTVYPGLTEEICIPILEEESKLKAGFDFKVAYSPERINPGDDVHTIQNTVKVVSAIDDETLEEVAELYKNIVKEGVFKTSSIRVAEAAKIVENVQRDVNIAFMNEVKMILENMDINVNEVLEAARSKWNFLDFKPGLVGGHCIGVDPYYLIYKSEKLNYNPNLIKECRKINNNMPKYIANKIESIITKEGYKLKGFKLLIKGITFKENIDDIRNSKIVNIIKYLENLGVLVYVEDEYANYEVVEKEYNIKLNKENRKYDAILFAVKHDIYKNLKVNKIKGLLKQRGYLIFDLNNMYDELEFEKAGLKLWNL